MMKVYSLNKIRINLVQSGLYKLNVKDKIKKHPKISVCFKDFDYKPIYGAGFTNARQFAVVAIPKWRWTPVELPVVPMRPIVWPALTVPPPTTILLKCR